MQNSTTSGDSSDHSSSTDARDIKLSAVVPMYNEARNVGALIEELEEVLESIGRPWEIVLVDDGSSDGTTAEIARHAKSDSRIQGVYLVRNYGQSTAMQAGFDAARGEAVVTLDGDLQNDPRDIPKLLQVLEDEGVDLVSGWRKSRKDPFVRRMFSRVANHILSYFTQVRLHDFGCSLKVYRRDVLEKIQVYGELHRFLPALIAEVGGEIREVIVNHRPRHSGVSKYSLDRTLRVILDLILILFLRKYLQRAMHIFGGIGLACLVPGMGILAYLFVVKVVFGQSIGDRPLLTLGMLMVLVGIILIGQGLLGELMGRLLMEAGQRQQYHLLTERRLLRLLEGRSDAKTNPLPSSASTPPETLSGDDTKCSSGSK